jgi:hypothetical protein
VSAAAHAGKTLAPLLEAAAARVEMTVRESHASVEELGEALARLTAAAGQLRDAERALAGIPAARTAASAVTRQCAAIESEVTACVERLQFYDRMTQELMLVRDSLAESARLSAGTAEARNCTAWEALRARICDRLTSESQRALLWSVVGAPVPSDGTVELF